MVEISIKALQKPFKKRVNRDDIKFRDKIEYVGGNTRSVKALRDYFALAESTPTPATLLTRVKSRDASASKNQIQKSKRWLVQNTCALDEWFGHGSQT